MFRLVLKDYKQQYRESVKRMNAAGYYIYFYFLIYVPIYSHMTDGIWKGLCFYAFFLPFCFGIFLSRLYPNRMSRTLLLCPLSRQQKEQYIRCGFVIRVFVPFFLYLIFEGGVMLVMLWKKEFVMSQLWEWTGITWFLFVNLVSLNIYCLPIDSSPKAYSGKYRLPGNYEIWNILVQLAAFFGGVIMLSALTSQEAEPVFDIIVEILFLVIATALCIKMIVTYMKPIMEQAISYEYCPPVQKERKRA